MTVSFNTIPINVRVPGQYIEFDATRAQQGLAQVFHKILVIGQRLASGSVAQGVPLRVLSAAQAEEAFGRGSMLSEMLAALKGANGYTECWAVALDDNGAGTAATGTLLIAGTATESGTLNVYVTGKPVQISVTSGDLATAVALALAAAVNARTDLPVIATTSAGTVTFTARHKGEVGNSLDLRIGYYIGERAPRGLTYTVAAMVGGTANPNVQTVLTAIGDEQYHTLITPYIDAANLVKIEAAMADRFGPMVQKEGHAFAAVSGTHATALTLGDSRNCPHLCIMASGKSPTPPYIWAAVLGAVDAAEVDPARPRQTLPLPGLMAPAEADRNTLQERNLHLFHGVATHLVDAGGTVLIERLVTTYRTNAFGVADISYLDIETLRTIAYLRYTVRARIALKYPRHKLANDGTRYGPGQSIVTPLVLRAELLGLFREWELAGLAEDFEQFNRDLIVERNASDPNRVDAVIPPNVVNQFRVFAGQVQFRL